MKNQLSPFVLPQLEGKAYKLYYLPQLQVKLSKNDNEPISFDEIIKYLLTKNEGVEIKQLTLFEAFNHQINDKNYVCPYVFANEDEHFNYWLRCLLNYNFSDVDLKTYTAWYQNISKGIETSYL